MINAPELMTKDFLNDIKTRYEEFYKSESVKSYQNLFGKIIDSGYDINVRHFKRVKKELQEFHKEIEGRVPRIPLLDRVNGAVQRANRNNLDKTEEFDKKNKTMTANMKNIER